MSLGDYVRVVRTFLDAFKLAVPAGIDLTTASSAGETDVDTTSTGGQASIDRAQREREDSQVRALQIELTVRFVIHN
jgi:hypothetical protein